MNPYSQIHTINFSTLYRCEVEAKAQRSAVQWFSISIPRTSCWTGELQQEQETELISDFTANAAVSGLINVAVQIAERKRLAVGRSVRTCGRIRFRPLDDPDGHFNTGRREVKLKAESE
ncbi:hypothetical protein Baya_17093 [Bagarius yarrelli]|uniref:Uncharacterized protein n=1 Tax=Bagarius yarrelli TaxID=175774 RepID=A0A556VXC7_BAGYA|nr:hypothetical protein Baya_17093 [Bagarius yarrelli]